MDHTLADWGDDDIADNLLQLDGTHSAVIIGTLLVLLSPMPNKESGQLLSVPFLREEVESIVEHERAMGCATGNECRVRASYNLASLLWSRSKCATSPLVTAAIPAQILRALVLGAQPYHMAREKSVSCRRLYTEIAKCAPVKMTARAQACWSTEASKGRRQGVKRRFEASAS